jgi:adenylate cyclase
VPREMTKTPAARKVQRPEGAWPMKYRTKLYLSLAGMAFVSSLSGFGVLFFQFRHHAFEDEQIKALTVAATTAALIDPGLFKNINTREDESSETYALAKRELIKARDANRRKDVFIQYVYTIKPNPKNPEQLIYSVDAEENPRVISHAGDPVENAFTTDAVHHLTDYFSPGKFIPDPYGVWISGFAPIYDKDGNYVATIGADISMENYLADFQEMMQYFLLAFLISLAFSLGAGFLLARQIGASLRILLISVREIGLGNFNYQAVLKTRDEFEELCNEINNMSKGLKERERLRFNFARYVSQHVMEKILQTENVAKLEGERRKITVLFSDIRQFTEIAEQLPPEQVVALLNEYFTKMLDVIFKHQGTLDKFLGDGIMVEFGAPLDDQHQERNAILTAIAMQKELKILLAKWQKEGKPHIQMGIGIHTGFAVVGNIGSEQRIEYTAIGDTVNVAARLEQATKSLKRAILVSETTFAPVKQEFKATSLGPLILPGRKEAIVVYAIEFEEK